MRVSRRLQLAGMVAGIALFVAGGLFATLGARPGDGLAPGPLPSTVTAPAEALSAAFTAVAAHVGPAVVSVYSEKKVRFRHPGLQSPFGDDFFEQFFGGPSGPQQPEQKEYSMPEQSEGTGMILDREGHILTNYHVVEDEDTIKVQLADTRIFDAKILGADPKTDVVVLELKGAPGDLPAVELGDSDALRVGSLVMAIGSPFGLTQTVTTGIISAKGRSDVGIADYEDFLQTDAPINPGNSGGPLINMRGEVVGMNSAIETNVGQFGGVGFAIPVNMIKVMLPTLLRGERIERGALGVVIQDLTKELAEQFQVPQGSGALVAQVNKGSAAERGGMRVGDVIVSYQGRVVENTAQLRNLVAATAPGTQVRVGIIRNGAHDTLTVTIGRLPGEKVTAGPAGPQENQVAKLGLTVQTLDGDLARRYGIREKGGVVITGVEAGSIAADYGLQPGDLIVEADHRPVTNAKELRKILDAKRDAVLLLVDRKGDSVFVVLKLR
jgi:serine protease Do